MENALLRVFHLPSGRVFLLLRANPPFGETTSPITSTQRTMKSKILSTTVASFFVLAVPVIHAGTFSVSPWTGDGDSGISSLTSYTAVVDFAGTGSTVVNGVTFTNTGAPTSSFQLNGALNGFAGFTNNLTGGSNALASDFWYSGNTNGNASVTLGNLIPGQNYVTTWYNAGFGGAGGRFVNITPGDTGIPFLFDENQSGAGNGNLLTYNFTAVTTLITFTFDAVSNGDSFHHYALTNAGPLGVAGSVLPVTPSYTAANGPGFFAPFSPLNNDLLQTSLTGAPGVSGNFTQEGAGGASILNNGAFSITGGVNPELATGENNSSVLYTLDLTGAPYGYDISQVIGYGGWNDGGRDRQLYQVLYSVIGDSGFTSLGTADFDVANPGQSSAIRAIFDTTLTGVDAIRFDFLPGQENGYAGYGEFDVVGVPTVIPEPSATMLLGLGFAAFVSRRRVTGKSRV